MVERGLLHITKNMHFTFIALELFQELGTKLKVIKDAPGTVDKDQIYIYYKSQCHKESRRGGDKYREVCLCWLPSLGQITFLL